MRIFVPSWIVAPESFRNLFACGLVYDNDVLCCLAIFELGRKECV